MISFRPRERAPRIGLVGWFGSGNLGNDGTLEALLGHLRTAYPQAAVDVLTNAPDVVTERYGLPATQLHWLHAPHPAGAPQRSLARRAVRVAHGAMRDACLMAVWVRRHDVAIVPGTGSLETTTAIRPWQLPWSLFILSASGRLLGTRVALVSVGASVVTDRLTRWLTVGAARLAHYRSFRDEYSRQSIRRMGVVDARDRVFPDLVFGLAPTTTATAVAGPNGRAAVGVGLMAWTGDPTERSRAGEIYQEYVTRLTEFTGWLVAQGYDVRLLVGDAEDGAVARAVQRALSDPRLADGRVAYEECSTLADVRHQIEQVDLVVATRYHNVLCGVMAAKPTIALSYGDKHAALMATMGMEEFATPVRGLDVERLRGLFTRLEAEQGRVRAELARRRDDQIRAVAEQFAHLDAALADFLPGGSDPDVPVDVEDHA